MDRITERLTYLMQIARSTFQDGPEDLLRFLRYPNSALSGGPVVLLSNQYQNTLDLEFLEDFQSRIWITYRSNFPPIYPSSLTSDSGWGCMLRTGQMLLANSLVFHHLGREWRVGNVEETWDAYIDIVSKFNDSNSASYSIHRISLIGQQFDKRIGDWFGPSTISNVLAKLVNSELRSSIKICIANDSVVNRSDVIRSFRSNIGHDYGVLLLIPLRLGLECLNSIYVDSIRICLSLKSCVGIAGGRPNSSLYFIGTEGDNLIYLDPHHVRPAIPPKDVNSYDKVDIFGYHCAKIRLLSFSAMDPSMVVGFYFKNQDDFEQFRTLSKMLHQGNKPIFTIQDQALDCAISLNSQESEDLE